MRGRFLEQWADGRAVQALPAIFAHYDVQDVRRALQATMELFHWLALETAREWGYTVPSSGEAHATKCVQELLRDEQ